MLLSYGETEGRDSYSFRIKDNLRHKFADLANNFEKRLRQISSELSSVEGPLEEQLEQVRQVQDRMPVIAESLQVVAAAEDDCRAANVDENDYTVFTVEDLRFELELVTQSILKKITFIENQVCPTLVKLPREATLTLPCRLCRGT